MKFAKAHRRGPFFTVDLRHPEHRGIIMSWLKIQAGLVTNKKTARLAGQMKWKKLEAVGFLVSFWIWAIENCEGGLLRDISDSELAFAVGVENAEGILAALKNSGLVDSDPLRIHDWPEHQGDYLRSKYRKSPEKYAAIFNQYRTSTVPVHVPDMSSTVPVPDRDRVDIIKRDKQPLFDKSNGFVDFWKAYPRKTGKGAAMNAWKKNPPPLDKCLSTLNWQIKSDQWTKESGQYIPLPATWLNQGRWEDIPAGHDIVTCSQCGAEGALPHGTRGIPTCRKCKEQEAKV